MSSRESRVSASVNQVDSLTSRTYLRERRTKRVSKSQRVISWWAPVAKYSEHARHDEKTGDVEERARAHARRQSRRRRSASTGGEDAARRDTKEISRPPCWR